MPDVVATVQEADVVSTPPQEQTPLTVTSPIPLPPPPPETDDEGTAKADKDSDAKPTSPDANKQFKSHKQSDVKSPPPIVKGEKKTVEINGQQVPSALISAFAQSTSKDKQPFAYIQGSAVAKFQPDQTRPSEVRREERKDRSQSRGPSIPKILPIVVPLESDSESALTSIQTPIQPQSNQAEVVSKPAATYSTSSPPSQTPSSVSNQQAFEFDSRQNTATYRPISFVPSSPSIEQPQQLPTSLISSSEKQTISLPSTISSISDQQSAPFTTDMSTIQHLQYNTPINMYSAQSAQQAFEQTTGQHTQTMARRDFNPDRSATYRTLLEMESDRQHGGRPLTPHSARMEEQPGDVYAGRYHGYVNAQAQSPSFRRLQAVANAGDQSEAGYAVREYEARALSSAQSHHDTRALSQTPSVVVPSVDMNRPHTPKIVEYTQGVEERPLDDDLATKIAEAERPKVPPPVTPTWAHKAADKQYKWSAAHGYDPRSQSEQRRYLPEQPHWQHGFDYSNQVAEKLQTGHQGRVYEGPRNLRSVTPSATVHSRTEMGGTDYGYNMYGYNRYDRARSVDPSHHYGTAPPRYVHKYRSAAEREWLKPYVAPNIRGDRYSENYGSLYANHDNNLARQNQSSRQDLTQLGAYYGPPTQARGGYQGATTHQYTTNYQQSLSRASVPLPMHSSQQKAEYHHSHQETTRNRSVTPRPVSTGLSPRQKEMGTSFLDGSVTPTPHQGEQPVWRSPSRGYQYNTVANQSSYDARQQYRSSSTLQESKQQNVSQTPVPPVVSTLPQSTITNWHTTAGNNWTITAGAGSKATTSGDYIDADGNKVHYTKQYQTTNDPSGKGECSLLTEEERKVMEEPLQPGVISRHVTTKYYKKSTYANQQTTTTSVPANKPLAITTGDTVKQGQVTPGVTQF